LMIIGEVIDENTVRIPVGLSVVINMC